MTGPRMRAGDSDRQVAVDRLTRHFTDGRLDPNEYDDRVQKAYAAAYLDEFAALFEDLPEDQDRPGRAGFGRDPGRRAEGADWRGRGAGGWGTVGSAGPGWPGPGRHPGWADGAPWGGRRPLRRPPAILAVLAVLAGLFFLGALATGILFVGFPLLWIGLVVLMIARGGCHRRWAGQGRAGGGGRYGNGGY